LKVQTICGPILPAFMFSGAEVPSYSWAEFGP